MHVPGTMDWNDLRYLLAIGRCGSTAAAARAVGVNQSTVVRRVSALEEALGLRLFDKKREGYRLTAEGAALFEEATAVEASVLAFSRRAASLDGAVTGSLRVTMAEGFALGLIAPLFNEFHRLHPGLQVDMLIENRFRDLGGGQVDVALRVGDPLDDKLVGRKLTDLTWAVYGSHAYVERHGSPTTPGDLDRHRLVGFGGILSASRWRAG